jgi:hypothetical protein
VADDDSVGVLRGHRVKLFSFFLEYANKRFMHSFVLKSGKRISASSLSSNAFAALLAIQIKILTHIVALVNYSDSRCMRLLPRIFIYMYHKIDYI